jgi:hypothetical protein
MTMQEAALGEGRLPLPQATWILVWNPDRWEWPRQELQDGIARLNSGKDEEGRWSAGVGRGLRRGDRCYLVRLGSEPRGLFASGRILSEVREGEHWDGERAAAGKKTHYLTYRLDEILDPYSGAVLALSRLKELFPRVTWNPRASGTRIPDDVCRELELEWQRHLAGSNAPQVRLVANRQQLDESIRSFDDALRVGSDAVRFAVFHPEHWVCDRASGLVAPAKWAALGGMSPVTYSALQQASRGAHGRFRGFTSERTLPAIEKLTGGTFAANEALSRELADRFAASLGESALGKRKLEDLRWLELGPARAYWWVNQRSKAQDERAGGYIQATQATDRGPTPRSRSDIAKLRPGDVIFCNQRGAISAVAIARAGPVDVAGQSPAEVRVPVAYRILAEPLPHGKFQTQVKTLQGEHGPLDINGRPKQGYLFPLEEGAATALLALLPPDLLAVIEPNAGRDANGGPVKAQNIILFGPPGTGKTYASALRAVELCDGTADEDRAALMVRYRELAEAGRIEFVTFHQSFSYEDFVEGIRPVIVPAHETPGTVGYECRDGIFKQLCSTAARKVSAGQGADVFEPSTPVWKMSIGQAGIAEDEELYAEALAEGHLSLGWGGAIDFSDCENEAAIVARLAQRRTAIGSFAVVAVDRFKNKMQVGDLVVVSSGLHGFRAIGRVAGPYRFLARERHCQIRRVEWLVVFEEPQPVERVYRKQLSQATIYRLAPGTLNVDGLRDVLRSPGRGGEPLPHVLVIDEINRGNIAKILGELITLLEPDKRLGAENELRVRLPYSNAMFGVPGNLHIIGTMNSADRSIALLDTALRRRFRFEEFRPEPEVIRRCVGDDGVLDGVDVAQLLEVINDRIELLLDREHRLGHAFFVRVESLSDLRDVVSREVLPLLQEYFFDDWGKICEVLGCAFEDDGAQANRTPILRASALDPSLVRSGADGWDRKVRCAVCATFLEGEGEVLRPYFARMMSQDDRPAAP